MPHAEGAYLGSVRDVATLRERCVIHPGSSCWHLRTPRGRPMPANGHSHRVHVFGIGPMSAPRAAWFVKHGELPAPGQIAYRSCTSYDCVNPEHIRCGPKTDLGALIVRRERYKRSTKRLVANALNARRRRALTDELAQWARESSQSSEAVSHALGVSKTCINDIRRGRRYRPLAGAAGLFSMHTNGEHHASH